MIQRTIDDVLTRPRNLEYKEKSKESPYPVVWIQIYGPATPQLKKIVAEANIAAKLSPLWKDEKVVLGIVNKRGKMLGDLILKRKNFALNHDKVETGSTRCTPKQLPGKKKPTGRPCDSCDMMSNKKTITSTVTGETFRTPPGNCKTTKCIYAAECRLCMIQYTGKTTNRVQKRICGHRSHVTGFIAENDDDEDDSDEKALAEHLFSEHGINDVSTFNESFSFTILEVNPKNLQKCEQMWVNRLVTLYPFGLNRDKPCGVSDSILNMSRRASQPLPQRR